MCDDNVVTGPTVTLIKAGHINHYTGNPAYHYVSESPIEDLDVITNYLSQVSPHSVTELEARDGTLILAVWINTYQNWDIVTFTKS
jgi:hypothetical protein